MTQSVSYGSKHASQPLSNTTFCAYLHWKLENYRMYMDNLHIDWLLCYQRYLFSVLELDVRYIWQVMAPNVHCSVFPISNLCVLTCITCELQTLYERSAIEQLLYYWRHSLRGLELHERSVWRATEGGRHASVVFQYKIVYIYGKPIHTWLFGAQPRVTTNSPTLWLHTTHQMMALLVQYIVLSRSTVVLLKWGLGRLKMVSCTWGIGVAINLSYSNAAC